MISSIDSVNILISLLKDYKVKDVVMAPGASDIPIIHVIEKDDYFNCYSVVDERSLLYFAVGVAQQKRVPVACVCTSGTAVSNFLPGMTEAYYQNVPIIAITADKNPNFQGQIETQKIEQVGIFGESSRVSVDLPIIKDKEDVWLCERLVNEALIEMTHHGQGPVHINVPIIGDIAEYCPDELPKCKKINLIEEVSCSEFNKYTHNMIRQANKIMIVVGQDVVFEEKDIIELEKFAHNYNCVIAVDHQSNLSCYGTVNTYPVTEMEKDIDESLLPTLVISLGNNIASYDLKYILRRNENIDHWQIDECGRIRDLFQHLTAVFECSLLEFFSACNEGINGNENSYLKRWNEECAKIKIDNLRYSSFYIAKLLAQTIPENSILHLAILNSTRLMQYFRLKDGVKTYSNFGALGIDGCLSTFMGQASVTDELAFCVIGDLSFFYDMNAAGIRHRKNNVRIILLNNTGAGEFYFTLGKEKIDTIDQHIAAVNNRVARGWVESLGYKYYAVTDEKSAQDVIGQLDKESDSPIFVEVFLDIEDDTKTTREHYLKYRSKGKMGTMKSLLKGAIGEKGYEAVKSAYHKIK